MNPSLASQRGAARPVRRRRHQWLKLALILIIVLIIIYAGLTPWALHIGGRFTPLTEWTGYGPARGSNGGRCALPIQMRGGLEVSGHGGAGNCSSVGGCDNISGTARLCTESGADYRFTLAGEVHSWLSTSGARTTLVVSSGTTRLPFPSTSAAAGTARCCGWPAPTMRSPGSSPPAARSGR